MNLVIEKLKKEDLKEAINIYDENHKIKSNYQKSISAYNSIYNNPAYHNIVAKLDDKIVGFTTIIINYDIVEESKPFLTIWNFGIKQEYRRQKIGTKMFKYIYEFAKKNSCDFISLVAEKDNKIAQSFYENLGYIKEVGYIKLIDKDNW